jgi:phosphoglycerol transferase MdoB-like AlkP superfamily enzyme
MRGNLRLWWAQILPSAVLLVLLVIMVHVYNLWAGLDLSDFYLRRTVAAAGLGLVLFGPAVLMRRTAQFIYLAIISVLVATIFIAHSLYAGYAGGFLSVSALRYFWQIGALGGSIKTVIGPQLAFYLTPLLALLVLFFIQPRQQPDTQLSRRAKIRVVTVLVALSLASAGFLFTREAIQEHGDISRLINQPFNSDELVGKIGIINYSFYDAIKYVLRKRGLDAEEQKFVQDHKAEYQFKPEGTQHFGTSKGKNLIYIQLESIQAFLIGLKVNGIPITPNLNELAASGLNFDNFHYTVGPGTSSDAEFSALNSLMYLGDKAVVFEYPNNHYQAMPQTLRDAGYETVAMHGDSRNFWNRSNIYPSFGYQHFYDVSDFVIKQQGLAWGLSDHDLFEQALPKLADLQQPYYAHLITFSSHTPFDIPAEYHPLELGDVKLAWIQKNYLQAAHYTDAAIGEFVKGLRDRGMLANTTIAMVGDHEGFIEGINDADFARALGYPNGFTDLTYLRSRQVPFIIYNSGLPAQTLSLPGSQLDIYPTLMNLMGLPTPSTVLGKDLLNTQTPLVARRRRGTGIDLEMALDQSYAYFGSESSSKFEDGKCYQNAAPARLEACRSLYERAYNRVHLSDLVVEGNALDLLK